MSNHTKKKLDTQPYCDLFTLMTKMITVVFVYIHRILLPLQSVAPFLCLGNIPLMDNCRLCISTGSYSHYRAWHPSSALSTFPSLITVVFVYIHRILLPLQSVAPFFCLGKITLIDNCRLGIFAGSFSHYRAWHPSSDLAKLLSLITVVFVYSQDPSPTSERGTLPLPWQNYSH